MPSLRAGGACIRRLSMCQLRNLYLSDLYLSWCNAVPRVRRRLLAREGRLILYS